MVSPKSLKLLAAEQFWNQNPIEGQRYVKGPQGFINEYNFFKQLEPNLLRERNKRVAQNQARRNEAARRIQQAWRHTKPTLTPANMRKILIMEILYRSKPNWKAVINGFSQRVQNKFRRRNLTPKEVNAVWGRASRML
jgi:hypothetical protein